MQTLELVLLLLAAVLLSSVISQLVSKVSAPLIQIGMGLLIALFAVTPIDVTLDPELFLVLFIAPLLFDEARSANKAALWKNKAPIFSLALGLVVATVLIVGFSVSWLIPSIPLAAAFALGAALGPTDAVAVLALSEEADLTERQKTILSGESLINDATGVVSFQFAIGAVVTGAFSLVDAGTSFAISFLGGIILGLIVGALGNYLLRRVRGWGLENTTFHVLFEMFTPFIVYLIAESFHVSGILAVVAAGLVGVVGPRTLGPSISKLNIVSSSVWRVFSFTLNGIVFVLLGMQLPRAMESSWDNVQIHNLELIGYVVALTALLELIRFIWIVAMDRCRKDGPGGSRCRITPALLRSALVTTLAGPKGAMTLSIAFTIPFTLSSGLDFPQRNLIIFMASGVILLTLLLANFAVPALAPKKKESTTAREVAASANIDILRKVVENLSAQQTEENRSATQAVIRSYNERIARVQDYNDLETEPHCELRIKVLRHQQNHVLTRIEKEEIDPVIGYKYIQHLARVQNLLMHKNDSSWLIQNALRHLHVTLQVVGRTLIDKIPGAKTTEQANALRAIQIDSGKTAIALLRQEMDNTAFAAENVSALLAEQERLVAALKSRDARPSITAITRRVDKAVDIEREGLRLELEQIQDMYDNDRIDRPTAKQLRENVYLMQIDLEDRI
ncbi:MAG: Na+/H+ antiporter [Raoultibacter sp.]